PPAARFARPPASIAPDRSLPWWRRMLPILLAHKAIVLSGLGCALATLLLQLAIPRLVRLTFDDSIMPELAKRAAARGVELPPELRGLGEPTALSTYVALLAGVAVVRFAIGYVYRYNLARTSFVIEYDLRNILYEKFQRLSFSYYDRVQSGQLISRANSDIRSVQMFLAFAPTVAISMITFCVAFALMATTHLLLAIVAVIPLPFVYVTGKQMRNGMFPVSWIISSRQADVATIVEENITGTRVVKSFAQEKAQVNALARAAQRLRWAGVLQVDIRAKWSPFMQNLPRLGLAAVLLYGGKLVLDGAVSIGTIIEFNAYVVMLQMPFMMLGFLMMMGQRAAASAARIFEIVDEPEDVFDRPGAVDLVDADGDVRFDGVTFAYGDAAPVLAGLSLHLAPGETVALVGRTGSGKSTVARLLPRFYDVQQGAVVVDGHDVRDVTLESLRSHIGLVLDEPFLFSETIRNNIAYGRPDASEAEVLDAARAAGVLEFVDKLPDGFDTVVGERGYTLSGGQRQRIAIARTLLVNPRILILDDATSAIDVHVEHEIHGALRTLMSGRTTLIIAHRLSTISLADRVVLLRDGRIFADGTHADLMATVPEYAEVLARAEEEWQAAHAPPPDDDALPPQARAIKHGFQPTGGIARPPVDGLGPSGAIGGGG
ncbi:MAG TPA: ABC transporter ATP-binding protein, partial [Acidimicrobiales bacterium]